MKDNRIVTTQRRGGKYEGIGFLLIAIGFVGGLIVKAADIPYVGWLFGLSFIAGCVSFLIGRFM